MNANSPAAVAAAFWSSWRPGSSESCWAAMPEPMTSAASSALPRYSASKRRRSGGFTLSSGGGQELVAVLAWESDGGHLAGDGFGVVGDALDRDLDPALGGAQDREGGA